MFSDPIKNIAQFGLEEGMKVADFGAGSGAYAIAAAKRVGGSGRVFAVDVQSDLLVNLKNLTSEKKIENIEIIRGDIDEQNGSKLNNESLDAVIVSNILFQSENKTTLVGEVLRVLKKGGRALVIDWSDSYGGMGPAPKDIIVKEAARKIFDEAGFEFERDIDAGEYHYGIIFIKK